MAKSFYIVRHAKSSWSDLRISDHQRKLNRRGKRDGPILAGRVATASIRPTLLISSDATRAWNTAKYFAKALFNDKERVQTESALYHGSEERFIDVINEQDNDHECIMLFGHNPGITYLANSVSDYAIDNVPTCGVLFIESAANKWEDVSLLNCKLKTFIYPKMFV